MPSRTRPYDLYLSIVAFILLAACLVLGGGTRQGIVAESLLQLLALGALLVAAFVTSDHQSLDRDRRLCIAWLASLACVLLCQLVPLPESIWSALPGRKALAAELALAGISVGWRPLSLDPQATLRALFALLPPTAMFVIAMRLDIQKRITLLQFLMAASLASLVLGFAQLSGGPESALRWYEHTSSTNAVGPFANRNHLASLLAISLPMCAAWLMVSYRHQSADRRAAMSLVAVAAGVLLVVGLAVTRSRAGIVLGVAAFFGIAAMAWLYRRRLDERDRRDRKIKRLLMLAAVIGLAVSMQYGLVDLLGRLKSDPLEDQRWTTAKTTLDAISTYGWTGTGAGTFISVYPSVEPMGQRSEYYVNRAHNDWLEWSLEGGIPLMIVVAVGLVLLVRLGLGAIRCPSRRAPWRWAALLGISLLLMHSVIDYPLRTTALSVTFALLVSCLLTDVEGRVAVRTAVTNARKPARAKAQQNGSSSSAIPNAIPNAIPAVPDTPWVPLGPDRVADERELRRQKASLPYSADDPSSSW